MPILVIRHPDGTERQHPLESELTIGRAPECDLVLSEGGVSRRHARVYLQGKKAFVEDLGSSNGTFVDGEPITQPTRVPPDARLGIGDYEMSILGGALPSVGTPLPDKDSTYVSGRMQSPLRPTSQSQQSIRPSSIAKPPPADALAVRPRPRPVRRSDGPGGSRWVLKGMTGLWVGQSYPLAARMLVGRVPPAAILIDDASVSRRHAEIELSATGVLVRDLQSANGTRVNGEPLDGEAAVKSGDVIEFGVVEFSVELIATAGSLVPSDGARIPLRPGRGRRRESGKPTTSGKRVFIVFGLVAIAVLLLVGGLMKILKGAEPRELGRVAANPQDPHARVEALLAECRTFSEGEYGAEPNWNRAQDACNKALDLDPINAAAVDLLKHIDLEKQAQQHFELAEKDLQLFQAEGALDEFAKIPQASLYYLKAKPRVLDAIEAVKRKAGDDCKRYLRDNLVQVAVPRCERYMMYACQNMSPDELRPPMGERLSLSTGRLKRNEWRPKDAMYLSFLRARLRVDPSAADWSCPELAIGRKGPLAEPPEAFVRRALEARFPDKTLYQVVLNYWSGRAEESIATLERFRNDNRKAQFHVQAEELQQKIAIVLNLFQKGEGALHNDDPDKATEAFDEVLKQDADLLKDEAEKHPSFFRRNIKDDMARSTFAAGKHWVEREDFGRACRLFKVGYRYSKENTDLLRGITRCSEIASEKLRDATTCADLALALSYASDGDGVKEKVAEQKVPLSCP